MCRLSATVLLVASLVLAGGVERSRAGGNIQIRDPADPSHVIPTRWDARRLPIHWALAADGVPGSTISPATLEAEVQAAFATWAALPTANVDFVYDGPTPIRHAKANGGFGVGIDGHNIVTFTDPDEIFPTGVLALTLTTAFTGDVTITTANADLDGDGVADLPEGVYPAGTVFDADIAFNGSLPWDVSGAPGTLDVRAVTLHEVGHVLGLCHSAIRDAVMWPFLPADVLAVRQPNADDVAWLSALYPNEPAYSATFGSIAGDVTSGATGLPVLGAHVYAVDPATQAWVVGGFSADDGHYVLPGLAPGSYLVGIEPLDGDPPGTEPWRVNAVVASTLDTTFPDEFYDAHEGAVEVDPTAATAVPVTPGAATSGIDITTNTLTLPGTNVRVVAGPNLFAWPVAVPAATTAFDLLDALGGAAEVASVDRYVPASGTFERAQYVDGLVSGIDFPITRTAGYVVHMRHERVVGFSGSTDCPALDLAAGLNLIGVPCRPPGYGGFALLEDLGGPAEVERVVRLDPDQGVEQVASYGNDGMPQGEDFPVEVGQGYQAVMKTPKGGVMLPSPGRPIAPRIDGLSPGRGVPGTVVAILGEGFDPDPAKNQVTFAGVPAAVIVATTATLTAAVPGAAASGPVRAVVSGRASNTLDFVVEPAQVTPAEGDVPELVSGQSAEAALGADGEQDRYTFTALAGSVVTIAATALNPGVPDLLLVLEDPYGAIAASDDNGGGGTDPRINGFTLTTSGTHTIVVTNVPGSGTGAYRVTLTIAPRPAPTQLTVLGGDGQTGQPGTELDDPLTVFATGPTGQPLSGIPISFVATEVGVQSAATSPEAADTVLVATNASGIVSIRSVLPNKSATFQIQVAIAGAKPITLTVAATPGKVAAVTMVNDQQHGAVGQPLSERVGVRLTDAQGAPVPGALVTLAVASGGGTIAPGGLQTSDADGYVLTTWTLGTRTSVAQVLAAVVPGRSKPLLFEAFPEADVPAKLESPRASYTRLTLGSVVANALWVRVLDQYGNPVPGVVVGYAAPPGVTVDPGVGPGGVAFTDFKTNADGLHVAAVTVPLGGAVLPTLDEFGARRAAAYGIGVSAGPANAAYTLDVDMGPRLVASPVAPHVGAMGAALATPLGYQVYRVERVERGSDHDFRTDDFTQLAAVNVPGALIHLEFVREDGNDETQYGLQPTRASVTDVATGADGTAVFDTTTLGDVPGDLLAIAGVRTLEIVFANAQNVSTTFTDAPSLLEGENVHVTGPRLIVELADPGSGIDLASVTASLNGTPYFNGPTLPGLLPSFPERVELVVGGRPIQTLGAAFLKSAAFQNVTLNFFPSLGSVHGGTNVLEVSTIADRAGNQDAGPASTSFTWP
jgi:protocatechuate 3,4-dioxygenase beta subunit